MILELQEPDTASQRLTVQIVLPSGVSVGCFKGRLVDDGDVLKLNVECPKPLIDVQFLHCNWDADGIFSNFYENSVGLEDSLKKLSGNRTDTVSCNALICLHFHFQSNIEAKFNSAWWDYTSWVLYVNLKAIVEDYDAVNDGTYF